MNNFLLSLKSWWYKNTHFEFFSIQRLYIPVFIYAFFQAIKMKSFNWISYVNPRIYKSGLFEHSKYELLSQLPVELNIKSIFIEKGTNISITEQKILTAKLSFPLVIKPDRLYRGIGIHKVKNLNQLREKYNTQFDILIQEYAQYQNEYAVFYVRFPDDKTGKVVSLIEKEFMQFIGDGHKKLETLIVQHPRAWLYKNKLAQLYSPQQLQSIPENNETISASFIGSHNMGTIFHNRLSDISPKMTETFDTVTKNIPEFYYGRYDIKADSLLDLEQGNFEVLELNAAIGEPVHMYDPKTSLYQGYSILLTFWSMMAKIAAQNLKRGISTAKKT